MSHLGSFYLILLGKINFFYHYCLDYFFFRSQNTKEKFRTHKRKKKGKGHFARFFFSFFFARLTSQAKKYHTLKTFLDQFS